MQSQYCTCFFLQSSPHPNPSPSPQVNFHLIHHSHSPLSLSLFHGSLNSKTVSELQIFLPNHSLNLARCILEFIYIRLYARTHCVHSRKSASIWGKAPLLLERWKTSDKRHWSNRFRQLKWKGGLAFCCPMDKVFPFPFKFLITVT